ncbi:MAG TPA: dephospho-CoA kinase [Dokdonella sp.]
MTTSRSRYTVALTGGIASGKSAVSDRFGALGVDVIDADLVSRELVAPGGAVLAEIAAAFGPGVLAADGSLDRRAMREIVFADEGRRRRLEGILHPRVRDILRERAHAGDSAYALLVIPLLLESGQYDWVDRVLVVDVPRELQHARLVARDGITPTLADAMLDAQATRDQRLAIADDVIRNDGTLADLDERVRALHEQYLARARGESDSVDP